MLVFISDLHFVDETAGKHNIATEAFRIFFQDIAGNVALIKNSPIMNTTIFEVTTTNI